MVESFEVVINRFHVRCANTGFPLILVIRKLIKMYIETTVRKQPKGFGDRTTFVIAALNNVQIGGTVNRA